MFGQMLQYGKKVFFCFAARHEEASVSFRFLWKLCKITLSNEEGCKAMSTDKMYAAEASERKEADEKKGR